MDWARSRQLCHISAGPRIHREDRRDVALELGLLDRPCTSDDSDTTHLDPLH